MSPVLVTVRPSPPSRTWKSPSWSLSRSWWSWFSWWSWWWSSPVCLTITVYQHAPSSPGTPQHAEGTYRWRTREVCGPLRVLGPAVVSMSTRCITNVHPTEEWCPTSSETRSTTSLSLCFRHSVIIRRMPRVASSRHTHTCPRASSTSPPPSPSQTARNHLLTRVRALYSSETPSSRWSWTASRFDLRPTEQCSTPTAWTHPTPACKPGCRPLRQVSIQVSVFWRPRKPWPGSRNRTLESKKLPRPTVRLSGTFTTQQLWPPTRAIGLCRPCRQPRRLSYTVYWDLCLNSKEVWKTGTQRRNPRSQNRCDWSAFSSFWLEKTPQNLNSISSPFG